MKRIIFQIIFALVLTVLLSICAGATNVYIDGVSVVYDHSTGTPYQENGTLLVPLVPTAISFGVDNIITDNPNGTVVIMYKDICLVCNTTEKAIYRNGTRLPSDYGLVWKGGPLYVPVSLFEHLGADISIGGSGALINKKSEPEFNIDIYAACSDRAYSGTHFFGEPYEPLNGTFLGSLDNASDMDAFTDITLKEPAIFTSVCNLSDGSYSKSDLEYAISEGKNIRLVLTADSKEEFIKAAKDTSGIRTLATELSTSGVRILLCFDCELTCTESSKYITDTEDYISAFRNIADIFRKISPSTAVCFGICSCIGEGSHSAYYPGDNYVNYIELNVCTKKAADTGMFREDISGCYSYKKPVILSLDIAGILNGTESPSEDILKKLLNFLIYLPIKHPEVKILMLSTPLAADMPPSFVGRYRNSVSAGISGAHYLSSSTPDIDGLAYHSELCGNALLPAEKVSLYVDLHDEDKNISHISYSINGKNLGTVDAEVIPYAVSADLFGYAGSMAELSVTVFGADGGIYAERSYTVNISASDISVSEKKHEESKKHSPLIPIVLIAVGIFATVLTLKKINDIFC